MFFEIFSDLQITKYVLPRFPQRRIRKKGLIFREKKSTNQYHVEKLRLSFTFFYFIQPPHRL